MKYIPGEILVYIVSDTPVSPCLVILERYHLSFVINHRQRHLRGSALAFQVGLDLSLPKQREKINDYIALTMGQDCFKFCT